MPQLQLSFNASFALKKEDLLKILRVAADEEGLAFPLSDLMTKTGLGNKKVGPMKSWAIRAGLVQGHTLSPEGQLILERDPYLISPLTDWFMHAHLSLAGHGFAASPNQPADWGGWPWLVYHYAPLHTQFTLDDLVQYSSAVFADDTPKVLTKNFKLLLRTYTDSTALSAIRWLTLNGTTYTTGDVQLPSPYLIGYILAKLWERDYPDDTSILTKTLLDQPFGLAALLGLSNTQLQTQLDTLETYAILEQRREVPPFQLVRRWLSPLDLLDKAYAGA